VITRVLGALLALAALTAGAWAATADGRSDVGEGLYLHGATGSGKPLEASRSAGSRLQGVAAACVNCHQRSGLGGREGRSLIPPVTGRYLYSPRAKDGEDRGISYVEGMRNNREPYNDTTLARAIREGVDSEGRLLSYLMPRYALGDADMAALVGYLKKLDRRKVPGVTDSTLHFATVITPDADPVKRRGMLDVMRQFVADRNARQMTPVPAMRSSGKTAYAKSMFMVHRRWELHVWELTGPESGWQQQLERHLASEPVFAVISGLGGKSWAPVQSFCERASLPCLFPNVEAPPADADRDFYSVYFSRGVRLEAELVGKALLEPAAPVGRVLQVYRAGDSGEEGAATLAALLQTRGIAVSSRVLPADAAPADATSAALGNEAGAVAVVMWLRPPDLAALPQAPPTGAALYVSGVMGGLERAPLPALWRAGTHMAYPFDLPEKRRVRVDYALGWIHARHIPLVAEQVQTDTYLACGLVSETLSHMVDIFVRDYLVERLQDTVGHRIVTGYYPRLSLSAGQRFASKGGYLVHFAQARGPALQAENGWLVP